jgi:hypothetical protein
MYERDGQESLAPRPEQVQHIGDAATVETVQPVLNMELINSFRNIFSKSDEPLSIRNSLKKIYGEASIVEEKYAQFTRDLDLMLDAKMLVKVQAENRLKLLQATDLLWQDPSTIDIDTGPNSYTEQRRRRLKKEGNKPKKKAVAPKPIPAPTHTPEPIVIEESGLPRESLTSMINKAGVNDRRMASSHSPRERPPVRKNHKR